MCSAWCAIATASPRTSTIHAGGIGFFTFVAGTNVLGIRQFMDGQIGWTTDLLGLGFIAWLLLGYMVPWTAVLGGAAA
jgi:hypothetical protein